MPTDPASDEGIRQGRFTAPPGATTVLLVRHGESEAAHPDRPFPLVDGHGDPALHPDGRRQAELVGRRLAAEHAAGATIDAIYVTSLRRTHETAAPLAAALGIEPVVEADLREVHLGDWEGGEFRRRVVAGDPVFDRVRADERWDHIPGAEPLEDLDRRVAAAIGRIVAAHPNGRVVVVSHGGVIGHLLHQATGARRFAFSGAANASISEVVYLGDVQVVQRFNDTGHLSG
jgi:probable phosphoglycerate mutase